MYHLLKNSLAYHKARPLMAPRDISKSPVSDIAEKLSPYEGSTDEVQPESEAIMFYMLNDAFAKLCQRFDAHEPLPAEADLIANLYVTESYRIAKRAIYYTLMIITRELRHIHDGTFKSECEKNHGEVFAKFLETINGFNEHDAVKYLCSDPPDMAIGDYVAAVAAAFFSPSWSASYGGDPWGNIAMTLLRMLRGETSVETFLDTVWTLCHNGGPIFNKGMLYKHYDKDQIVTVLDVQRAGMMPQYVAEARPYVTPDIKKLHAECVAVLGESFIGYVDWFVVEALGAKKKYPEEKAAQVQKYGLPSTQHEGNASQHQSKEYYVMPGVSVEIVPRKKAA